MRLGVLCAAVLLVCSVGGASAQDFSIGPNEEVVLVNDAELACIPGSMHEPDPNKAPPYTHFVAVGMHPGDASNANMQPLDCRVVYDPDGEFPD